MKTKHLTYLLLTPGILLAVPLSLKGGALLPSVTVAEPTQTHFRKVPWGASKADVVESEVGQHPLPGRSGPYEVLTFPDSLAGAPCRVAYSFLHNKLVQGVYMVAGLGSELDRVGEFRDRVRDQLIKKYGSPSSERLEGKWENESEDSRRINRQLFREKGVDWLSIWKSGPTTILLVVKGKPWSYKAYVQYFDPTAMDPALAAERSNEEGKF